MIERWPLVRLKPHPRNPRKHPELGTKKWAVLHASLSRDYFAPLVVNRLNGMSGGEPNARRTLLKL